MRADMDEKEVLMMDGDVYKGVGIHSQVRKIKQEMEKINRLTLQQQQEARPPEIAALRHNQRSRSPLGLAERPIPVGN